MSRQEKGRRQTEGGVKGCRGLHEKKTMINKEQLAALIKAVEEGGDDDDEITEDEAIAILQDTGLDAEIPSVREWFAWERSQKRPQ